MKAAFFHDAPLLKDIDGNYYSLGFPYKIWQRYLRVFNSLLISTRIRYAESKDTLPQKMKLSSGPKVDFKPISAYQKKMHIVLKRKLIQKQIRETLTLTDIAVIRLPSFIGQIACEEAEKMGKPYIIEVVGCTRDALWNYSTVGKFLALPTYLSMKKVVRNSKHTIYVTNEFLQKRYPTSGQSINCSNVYLREINENVLNKRLNKIKDLNLNEKKIIGTTGAVNVKYKGQEAIIKTLSMLKKAGSTNYEYQLVGGGDTAYLKSIAKRYNVSDQVKFLGVMPQEEVINWLDTIDIYAQPSKTEGLPRSVIEAMSRGLLVIGSNAGGIPELIEKEFIFSKEKNNEKEILNILKIISKDDLIKQAHRNFNVSKEYDRETIDIRREKFIKRIMI